MNRKIMSVAALLAISYAFAQKDSLGQKNIEEVVLTGQYNPQSVNKSMYKVEVINAEQIKNMAATNVADVLNQSLNILIIPDTTSGNSTANIMGLDGSYVKILIDNIPVVGDTGLGSNIDLTKLTISNVERIEVVQGSMGVEYGNGALAGVINIITRKNASKKISLRALVQEETVRDTYDIRKKGKGRHIQNINIDYNLDKNWFANINFNHNDFNGYEGAKNGYKFFYTTPTDKRGYDWNPKDQLDGSALIKYSKNNTTFFYKLSYLKEKFYYYSPDAERKPLNDGNGGATYLATDREYNTDRWIHQFNIQSKLGNIRYNGDFSYQSQDRKYFDYGYDVPNRQILNENQEQSYYKTNVIYSRGMFSNFLNNKVFDFQLGYELDHTSGYASLIAGEFDGNTIKRKIFTYSNFLSAEWNITDKLSIRSGARLSLSDSFNNQFNYSATAKYRTSAHSDIRASFGTANRYPTYDELYTYFVNINHDLQGNPDLTPEKGRTFGLFWNHVLTNSGSWKINYNTNFLYVVVKDKIDMILMDVNSSTYRYYNLDYYRNMMLSADANFQVNRLSFGVRASLNGVSQKFDEKSAPSDINYYFQAGANANYRLKKWDTQFSLFYKFNGEEKKYRNSGDIKKPVFDIGTVQSFSMMDFIISQPFYNNHLEFSLGVKNIFDVTNLNDTTLSSQGHSTNTSSLSFYGRSYLARLTYQF